MYVAAPSCSHSQEHVVLANLSRCSLVTWMLGSGCSGSGTDAAAPAPLTSHTSSLDLPLIKKTSRLLSRVSDTKQSPGVSGALVCGGQHVKTERPRPVKTQMSPPHQIRVRSISSVTLRCLVSGT